jgi:tetratricopeptide (TPR) repeat protein
MYSNSIGKHLRLFNSNFGKKKELNKTTLALDLLKINSLKLKFLNNKKIIGRKKDFEHILMLLKKNKIVQITGPAGIGKTTIATLLFNHFVELDSIAIWYDAEISPSSSSLYSCVNQQIGPSFYENEDLLQRLVEKNKNRNKGIYIFIDNYETILQKNSEGLVHDNLKNEFLKSIIKLASICKIVIMSRFFFANFHAEANYCLPSIDKKFYLSIFKNYLPINPTNADKVIICKICEYLNGNPLAIKIATPLISKYGYSLANIYSELLERGADVLTMSNFENEFGRGVGSFSASIDLSYSLLPEKSKYLFMVLSIWKGFFNIEILNEIIDQDISSEYFYNLIDAYLIELVGDANNLGYVFMPMLRQFAIKKFDVFNRDNNVFYANEFHNKCVFLHKWGHRNGQGWTASSATTEISNLDVFASNAYESLMAAILHCKHSDMLLVWEVFWRILELFIAPGELSAIGRNVLNYTLEINDFKASTWTLINSQGYSFLITGDFSSAQRGLEVGIKLGEKYGEYECIATGWRHLARIAIYKKNYKLAESYYIKSLNKMRLVKEPERSRGIGSTYVGLARVYIEQGRYSLAEKFSIKAVEILRRINDLSRLSSALLGLGTCYFKKYKTNKTSFCEAEEILLEAASFLRRETKGQALFILAELYLLTGNSERARECIKDSIAILESINAIELDAARDLHREIELHYI